jgi:hypothetical protein
MQAERRERFRGSMKSDFGGKRKEASSKARNLGSAGQIALLAALALSGCSRFARPDAFGTKAEPTIPPMVTLEAFAPPEPMPGAAGLPGAGLPEAAPPAAAPRADDPAVLATIAAMIGADPTTDAPVIQTLAASVYGTPPPPAPGNYDPTQSAAIIQTLEAMATQLAASPTPPPVIDPGNLAASGEAGCEIPREPFRFALAPAPDAPPDLLRRWAESQHWSFEAELVESAELEAGRSGRAKLRLTGAYAQAWRDGAPDLPPAGKPLPEGIARELPAGLTLDLDYRGPALPLVTGRRYLVAYGSDQAGGGGDGEGLLVADDQGLLMLGLSLREADGAERRVLAGLRGGFEIQQLPTECRHVASDGCGFELRAAPVLVAAAGGQGGSAVATAQASGGPARSLRLNAGETASLNLEQRYTVRLATSHLRLWRGDQPCPDPADWRLSIRIERGG